MQLQEWLKGMKIPEILRKKFGAGEKEAAAAPGSKDIHLGEPGFLHKILREKKLEGVFLFVTSRCNSRCRTCFYSGKLNRKDDLTFEQIQVISRTAPRFDKLWLSGGEPFLRGDLAEIIEMFYRTNGVKVINLPTNGILVERIAEVVGRLLESCPEMTIHLNFSLDGLGETHDRIRGVPGNFRKTVAAMDMMQARYGGHPRLHRNVATVVTREGYGDIARLCAYLFRKNNTAIHFLETMRGTPRDPGMENVSRRELEELHDRILPLYEGMADRLFSGLDPGARRFAKMYFMGVIKFNYLVQERNLEGPQPWDMPCMAGISTFVVDHDGAFRACELRPAVGHLRDFGFDLTAAMSSGAMKREIEAIGGGRRAGCWCTHSCWIQSSMQFKPTTLLLTIPWSFARYKLQRLPPFDLGGVDIAGIENYGGAPRRGAAASRRRREARGA